MRVLMLTTSYPRFAGDVVAPFVERMATGVADEGHAVDVVLPRHRDFVAERRRGGDAVRFFPFFAGPSRPHLWGYASSMAADRRLRGAALAVAPAASFAALAVMRRRLAADRYDLVHAHWVLPNGPIAALAAGGARLPLIVSLHGSDVFVAEKSRALGALARWVFRRSAAVSACSRDLAERASRFGADAEVIPYGVDAAELGAQPASEWRQRAGAGDDELLVVGLGRLVAKKGFETLIAAVAELRANAVPVRLALGGRGDLQGPLVDLAAKLGCAEAVVFFGEVPHDEVGGLLRAADAVAVPSVRDDRGNVDGLPNVLLEALACGRPIVASAVGGIPDVVTDGQDGLLVPPGDASALTRALRRLLDEPGLADELSRAAAARAKALSWPEHARRLTALYARASRDLRAN